MIFNILVHKGQDEGAMASVLSIARAAKARNHVVKIFAMAAGVTNLAREDFISLIDDGVEIAVCSHNCGQYKAPMDIEGVNYGSQYDLALSMNECDRFISFV